MEDDTRANYGRHVPTGWLHLAHLRALDEDKRRKAPRAFVLRETSIEALAHLGPRAFAEIDGEVVNTALFVLAKEEPPPHLRLTAFRFVGPKSLEEKDALLREAIRLLVGKAAADEPRRKGSAS